MKKLIAIFIVAVLALGLSACSSSPNSQKQDSATVEAQNKQYAARQPVPVFDWSLERHLVIQLYKMRNTKAVTHAVWRSQTGQINGDCPCMGYAVPRDTSLTNPQQTAGDGYHALTTIAQAEPNGMFPGGATDATWVMCVGEGGMIEPVETEDKVTTYPYPVTVDYEHNRVKRAGAATVTLNPDK